MINNSVKQLLRLFKYAVPYWKTVIVVMICSVIYSSSAVSPAILTKPMVDNVLMGAGTDIEKESESTEINEEPKNESESASGEHDTDLAEEMVKNTALKKNIPSTDKFTEIFRKRGWSRITVMWFIFVVLITAALVGSTACFGKEYLKDFVLFRILVDIRQDVGEHLMKLSFGFFSKKKVGELISHITNDIQVTQKSLDFIFGDIVEQPLTILMSVFVMFYYSWQLAVLTLFCFPILSLPMTRLGKRIRRSGRQSLDKLADVTETMQQMFSGIRIVKSFRLEAQKSAELREANKNFFAKSMKLVRARVISRSVLEFSYGIGVGVLLLLASYMVIHSHWDLTTGKVFGFCAAIATMYKPVKTLAKAYNIFQESLAGSERVFEILDTKPEIEDSPDATEMDRMKKGIELNNVWFAYDTEPIIKDFSLSVKVGEVIAIVGPSGAGKSTLLDIISRFYDITGGSILIDGIDIREIKRDSLLRHIAIVSQDPFIFNTSIRDNIAYGRRGVTDEEIQDAAKAANIHDFILSLEKGYDTVVGERGMNVSGGERQRLSIARAILKDADILLLDEATSSLDTKSEQIVQKALNNLMEGRTTFIIAHRLSTVQHADRIVVLDNGKIAQIGSHTELLEQGGLYKKLYEIQFVNGAQGNSSGE
ncbi:MAG: ABC transporter ATP-binding protein [Planctomycetota bacterium]